MWRNRWKQPEYAAFQEPTMQMLQRNQLVWLTDDAWQQVLARNWDAQAQYILRHWHVEQLPLVVCTQRVQDTAATVSLGLPAPNPWNRRKLALEVPCHALQRAGVFPTVAQVALQCVQPGWQPLINLLMDLHRTAAVYGSFGWQFLTGLDYVRPTSDLDISAPVPDHASAAALTQALADLHLPLRLDGELVFPDGSAMAWREYGQWMRGAVDRVLVKRRCGVQLMDADMLATLEPDCTV
jgi:phosphoribosyl-dephospho-CoA transferase